MTESLTLVHVDWSDGSARVRVRRGDAATTELVPLAGLQLNYVAGAGTVRVCVGHKPFRNGGVAWVDCFAPPLHEGHKCDRCAAVDATFASQLHHAHNKAQGELDAAVVKHLDQPNVVYLAAFRDGSIKVGTSTERRLVQRLTEQGAWIASVVATATNGKAVRVLEDRVSSEIGLPQSVSIRRKLDGLVRPLPDSKLIAELDLWANRVHELVEQLADDRLAPLSTTWNLEPADADLLTGLHPYPLKLSSGAHDIEFLTAVGRAAVLRRPGNDDRFVADLRQLYGLVLELGDHQPDELAVQDSLF